MIREFIIGNNDILCIGIYGMGGVGKTTLVTHVYNELLNHLNFSVFWMVASQNFSILKLQNDIAEAMNVDLKDEEDVSRRATILAEALKKRESPILILDDLWNDFPLENAGIVRGSGCKLVFTTRSLKVCHRMDSHMQIKVETLSNEESWALFTQKLGTGTPLTPQIKEIAKSLVEECDGLPLGIITVAGSMRGVDDICEWSNALETLRQATWGHDEDMQFDKVFRVLRYSYDMLKSQTLQECFLYCSLYPEDHEIERDELIAYFIDEGLIGRMGSRQAEFNRGHTILNVLENVCLLHGGIENFEKRRYVKMHDLIRDMALQIAKKNSRFLVKAAFESVNVLDSEIWSEELMKICPLSDLRALKRLDLSGSGITELPEGMDRLTNLRDLSLSGTHKLQMIPEGVLRCLCNLQRLKLPIFHGNVKVRGIEIASLRKLELFQGKFYNINELHVYLSSWEKSSPGEYRLQVGDSLHSPKGNFEMEKSLQISDCQDLNVLCDSLKKASDLRLCTVSDCPQMTHLFCLACYSRPLAQRLEVLNLVCMNSFHEMLLTRKCASSSSAEALTTDPAPQANTFSYLKEFRIQHCHKIKKLFTLPLLSNLQNLERFHVCYGQQLVEIVQVPDEDQEATSSIIVNTLPKLKILNLFRLPQLKSFCSSRKLVCESLKEIHIEGCPNLDRLPLFREDSPPPTSLERISVSREWWETIKFDHPNTKDVLTPFLLTLDDSNSPDDFDDW
ncbi:NB-ARC domain, LRR domain containing protein [Trema orientale]|uniref:NB-ARC domain, LRR domain containing protein n=1 Tax=Trema orientale TaxID=63057 RepID=A0A2P5CHI1_TREOI|nr:NB-ARC domain, LRR domain containing protein [Trema orientale]